MNAIEVTYSAPSFTSEVDGSVLYPGGTAEISCMAGFAPSTSLGCDTTGNWNTSTPNCLGKITYRLKLIAHAKFLQMRLNDDCWAIGRFQAVCEEISMHFFFLN